MWVRFPPLLFSQYWGEGIKSFAPFINKNNNNEIKYMPSIFHNIEDGEMAFGGGQVDTPELLKSEPGWDIGCFSTRLNKACDAFFKRRGIPIYGFSETNTSGFREGLARRNRIEQETQNE